MSNTINFATNHRWLANIPLPVLFPSEDDVVLNLSQFDIPELDVGAMDVAYLGYTVEQPTGMVHAGEKTIEFTYMLDTDMKNYWLMYNWAEIYTKYILDTVTDNDEMEPPVTERIPISVIILDVWKKPVFKVTYHDCWIKSFNSLGMSYQDEPEPLQHSFTVAYSRISVERITD